MTLQELKPGKTAVITAVGGSGALRQHLLDMGILPGAEVTVIQYAPMGDPVELRIHGYGLALRLEDAAKIDIQPSEPAGEAALTTPVPIPTTACQKSRRYSALQRPSSQPQHLTFALAGNQNCGKTTLFNQLTGSNQHVGNFPGVTVEQKSGTIIGHPEVSVTDLPGIYSLSPYSREETVSRHFLLEHKPSCIINIADATNIERNLSLTLQLLELELPTVLALNMMDEVQGNGGVIDSEAMEALLGIPVVPISAARNQGIDLLIQCALQTACQQRRPFRTEFCGADQKGSAVRRCLRAVGCLIEENAAAAGIPLPFAAAKATEGDLTVLTALKLSQDTQNALEQVLIQMERETALDRAAAIADMRFSFIRTLCAQTVRKPKESKEHLRSRKIDRVFMGTYTAIPAFALVILLMFLLTFQGIGAWLQGLLEDGIAWITSLADAALTQAQIHPVLHSLIVDGIFGGVGSVLSFIPIIVILFLFLSILEDSGYMARVAFIMDQPLRKLGLSGRSIVPLMIGFGCTVPGVMATRTLPSERDRNMTVFLTPFMSCSAKLPIYGFLARTFFPAYSGWIIVSLYCLGIAVGILTATLTKSLLFQGEAVPFVLELPHYRMPRFKNVSLLLWDKAKDFLQRAFTVIFAASIVIWFLQSFDFQLHRVSFAKDSMLASIAGFLEPLFRLVGFDDWRVVTALIAGFMAKESVVSTLSVLFGSTQALLTALSPVSAASLLVFCLLYTPCAAAVASIKRELGRTWAWGIVLGQCAIAWVCALLIRAVGLLLL